MSHQFMPLMPAPAARLN